MNKAKLKIKKGDEVIVITGKNNGAKGAVLKVFTKTSRVLVSGVNVVSKHTKPSATSAGGVIKKELPLHISNVSHVDPTIGIATRIGYKVLEDGRKVRFAKKSGALIDN
jgi:large subunit ribosomal protein L24